MKYIVEGPALAKLLQENRIRVLRGEITFTPLTIGEEAPTIGEEDDKSADVSDDKEVAVTDCKKPKKKGKK